jgi:hypothetical protein
VIFADERTMSSMTPADNDDPKHEPAPTASREKPHSLADDLQRLREAAGGEAITFQRLIDVLSDRGHAVIILLLAAPFIVLPIPGLSTAVGLVICLMSVALFFDRKPWVPGWIGRKSISPEGLDRIVRAATGTMRRLSRLIRPRMGFVTSGLGHRAAGVSMLAAAIAFGLPGPPGNNIPPAICITVLALGLLERDGLMVIVGHVLTWLLWAAIIVLVVLFWHLVEPYLGPILQKITGGSDAGATDAAPGVAPVSMLIRAYLDLL